jgi:WhiB family redox-sensing transcriptional regulator
MPQQSSTARQYTEAAERGISNGGSAAQADRVSNADGVSNADRVSNYVPSTPENWFVDPIRLGVPGVRQPAAPGQVDDNPLAWQSDSLCAQTDPEAFFPEKGGSTRDAKKICASCEVRVHCLEYALENDERFGIWGGLSERERRKLRKRA